MKRSTRLLAVLALPLVGAVVFGVQAVRGADEGCDSVTVNARVSNVQLGFVPAADGGRGGIVEVTGYLYGGGWYEKHTGALQVDGTSDTIGACSGGGRFLISAVSFTVTNESGSKQIVAPASFPAASTSSFHGVATVDFDPTVGATLTAAVTMTNDQGDAASGSASLPVSAVGGSCDPAIENVCGNCTVDAGEVCDGSAFTTTPTCPSGQRMVSPAVCAATCDSFSAPVCEPIQAPPAYVSCAVTSESGVETDVNPLGMANREPIYAQFSVTSVVDEDGLSHPLASIVDGAVTLLPQGGLLLDNTPEGPKYYSTSSGTYTVSARVTGLNADGTPFVIEACAPATLHVVEPPTATLAPSIPTPADSGPRRVTGSLNTGELTLPISPIVTTGNKGVMRALTIRVQDTASAGDYMSWPCYPKLDCAITPGEAARYMFVTDTAYPQQSYIYDTSRIAAIDADSVTVKPASPSAHTQQVQLHVGDTSIGAPQAHNLRFGWRGRQNAQPTADRDYYLMVDWQWASPSCSASATAGAASGSPIAADINEEVVLTGSFDANGSPNGTSNGWTYISGPTASAPSLYDQTSTSAKFRPAPSQPNFETPYRFRYSASNAGGSCTADVEVFVKNYSLRVVPTKPTLTLSSDDAARTATYDVIATCYNGFDKAVSFTNPIPLSPFSGSPDAHFNSGTTPGSVACAGGAPGALTEVASEARFTAPATEPPATPFQMPGGYSFPVTGMVSFGNVTQVRNVFSNLLYVECPADLVAPDTPVVQAQDTNDKTPWENYWYQTRTPQFTWRNVADQPNPGALRQCWDRVQKYQYQVRPLGQAPVGTAWADVPGVTDFTVPNWVSFSLPGGAVNADGRYSFFLRAVDSSTSANPSAADATEFRTDTTAPVASRSVLANCQVGSCYLAPSTAQQNTMAGGEYWFSRAHPALTLNTQALDYVGTLSGQPGSMDLDRQGINASYRAMLRGIPNSELLTSRHLPAASGTDATHANWSLDLVNTLHNSAGASDQHQWTIALQGLAPDVCPAVPSVVARMRPVDQAGNPGDENFTDQGTVWNTRLHYDNAAPAVSAESYIGTTQGALVAEHPWTQNPNNTTLTWTDGFCANGQGAGLARMEYSWSGNSAGWSVPASGARTVTAPPVSAQVIAWPGIGIPFLEHTLTVQSWDKVGNTREEQSLYRQCYVDNLSPERPDIESMSLKWHNDPRPTFTWNNTQDIWPITGEDGYYPTLGADLNPNDVPAACQNTVTRFRILLRRNSSGRSDVPRLDPPPLSQVCTGGVSHDCWTDWTPSPAVQPGEPVSFRPTGNLPDGWYTIYVVAIDSSPIFRSNPADPLYLNGYGNASDPSPGVDFYVDTTAPTYDSLTIENCDGVSCIQRGTTSTTVHGLGGRQAAAAGIPVYYVTDPGIVRLRTVAFDDKPRGFNPETAVQTLVLSGPMSPGDAQSVPLGATSLTSVEGGPPHTVFAAAASPVVTGSWEVDVEAPTAVLAHTDGEPAGPARSEIRWRTTRSDNLAPCAASAARVGVDVRDQATNIAGPLAVNSPRSLELRIDGQAPFVSQEVYNGQVAAFAPGGARWEQHPHGWSRTNVTTLTFRDPSCDPASEGVGLVEVRTTTLPGDVLTTSVPVSSWTSVYAGAPQVTVSSNVALPERMNTVFVYMRDGLGNTSIERSVYRVDQTPPDQCGVTFTINNATNTATVHVSARDAFLAPDEPGSGIARFEIMRYRLINNVKTADMASWHQIAVNPAVSTLDVIERTWQDSGLVDESAARTPSPDMVDGSSTHQVGEWKANPPEGRLNLNWIVNGAVGTQYTYDVRCIDAAAPLPNAATGSAPTWEHYQAPEIAFQIDILSEDPQLTGGTPVYAFGTLQQSQIFALYRDSNNVARQMYPNDAYQLSIFGRESGAISLAAPPYTIPCGTYFFQIASRVGYLPTGISPGTPNDVRPANSPYSQPLGVGSFYVDICPPQFPADPIVFRDAATRTIVDDEVDPPVGYYYTNDSQKIEATIAVDDEHAGLASYVYNIFNVTGGAQANAGIGTVVVKDTGILRGRQAPVTYRALQQLLFNGAAKAFGDLFEVQVEAEDNVIESPGNRKISARAGIVVYDDRDPEILCRSVIDDKGNEIPFVENPDTRIYEVSVNSRRVDILVYAIDEAAVDGHYTLRTVTLEETASLPLHREPGTDDYRRSGYEPEPGPNDLLFVARDYATNDASILCRILFFPPVHLDISQAANVTGTLTEKQTEGAGNPAMHRATFATTISVPGAKGLLATGYATHDMLPKDVYLSSRLVPTSGENDAPAVLFNPEGAHSELTSAFVGRDVEQYAIRFEGRVKAKADGRHQFAVYAGSNDQVTLSVDAHASGSATPVISWTSPNGPPTHAKVESSTAPTCLTVDDGQVIGISPMIRMEPGAWYGLRLDYKADISGSAPNDNDTVGLLWRHEGEQCFTPVRDSHLAFSAGGISEHVQPFEVAYTLPPGFTVECADSDDADCATAEDSNHIPDIRVVPAGGDVSVPYTHLLQNWSSSDGGISRGADALVVVNSVGFTAGDLVRIADFPGAGACDSDTCTFREVAAVDRQTHTLTFDGPSGIDVPGAVYVTRVVKPKISTMPGSATTTVRWRLPAGTTCPVDPIDPACRTNPDHFSTRIPVGTTFTILTQARAENAFFLPRTTPQD